MPTRFLGLGRICIDTVLCVKTEAERVGSVKIGADLLGTQIGGSVPRILSCLSSNGNHTMFIGSISSGKDDTSFILDKLNHLNIHTQLYAKQCVGQSFVIFKDDFKLSSIISVNENEDDLIKDSDIDIPIISEYNPDCVILDLRHPQASLKVAKWALSNNKQVFLDPGTSQVPKLKEQNNKDLIELLGYCSIIIASRSFFEIFCQTPQLSSVFHCKLFKNLKMAVCNLNDGSSVVSTNDYYFTVRRETKVAIKNSFGVGDISKAWFLHFLFDSDGIFQQENVISAIQHSSTVAAMVLSRNHWYDIQLSLGCVLQEHRHHDYKTIFSEDMLYYC